MLTADKSRETASAAPASVAQIRSERPIIGSIKLGSDPSFKSSYVRPHSDGNLLMYIMAYHALTSTHAALFLHAAIPRGMNLMITRMLPFWLKSA
jgi:hypothetical protein